MDVLVYGLAGLAIGLGALVAYILKQRGSNEASESLAPENRLLKEEIQRAQQVENSLREELRQSDAERIEKATLNDELNKKLESQVAEQEKLTKQMHEKFENLANKILDQKSAKFTESNKENIKSLLEPLDKDIRNFRKKVEDIHEKDVSQHASLKEFLGNLQQAQAKLSEDARNLTTALKGDSRSRGTGGNLSSSVPSRHPVWSKGWNFRCRKVLTASGPMPSSACRKTGRSWWTQRSPLPPMSGPLARTMRT